MLSDVITAQFRWTYIEHGTPWADGQVGELVEVADLLQERVARPDRQPRFCMSCCQRVASPVMVSDSDQNQHVPGLPGHRLGHSLQRSSARAELFAATGSYPEEPSQ